MTYHLACVIGDPAPMGYAHLQTVLPSVFALDGSSRRTLPQLGEHDETKEEVDQSIRGLAMGRRVTSPTRTNWPIGWHGNGQ
jgi:hypothetical protein